MSAIQKNQSVWPQLSEESHDSKYEKCRNITEEIYKRINITFQIKKLEATQSEVSDHSDQLDSNDLSNETDLFACDKSDSLSSSTEAEKPSATCEKYININNNEETKVKKAAVVYKRPRKRFRKRVKKRQTKCNRSDSDGSSDEAPLSRIVEVDSKCVKSEPCPNSESPDNVMGVPNIVILTKDLKPKIQPQEKSMKKESVSTQKKLTDAIKSQKKEGPMAIDKSLKEEKNLKLEWNCSLCSLAFRGERGLRRHMTMSHIISTEDIRTSKP